MSWLNLGEYALVSDPKQRRAAEHFVEGILPSVFCLQVDLAAVDKGERAGHPMPYADSGLAALFVGQRGGGASPFTATGLFAVLHNKELAATRARLGEIMRGRLEDLRRQHSEEEVLQEAVRCSTHPEAIQATTRTRVIVRELVATFFPDLKRPITVNDGIDFVHAAIPVRYCDVVLLDGATVDMVQRARRKLSGTGITMATAFSGRRDGVEQFLAYLEATG